MARRITERRVNYTLPRAGIVTRLELWAPLICDEVSIPAPAAASEIAEVGRAKDLILSQKLCGLEAVTTRSCDHRECAV